MISGLVASQAKLIPPYIDKGEPQAWHTASADAYAVFSNSNYTVTMTSPEAWRSTMVRGTIGASNGKRYVEFEAGNGYPNFSFGIMSEAAFLYTTSSQQFQIGEYGGIGMFDGNWVQDSVSLGASGVEYTAAAPAYDTIMFAIDFDAGKIWVGKNGTWVGDPVAGTGGITALFTGTNPVGYGVPGYPCATVGNSSSGPEYGGVATINAEPTRWAYDAPTGFVAFGKEVATGEIPDNTARYWGIRMITAGEPTDFAGIGNIIFAEHAGDARVHTDTTKFTNPDAMGVYGNDWHYAFTDAPGSTYSWIMHKASMPYINGYDFNTLFTVREVRLRASFNPGHLEFNVVDFDIVNSNDNVTWSTVQEVRGQAAWSASEERIFTLE